LPFNYGTPDGLRLLSPHRPLQNFDERFLHGKIEYWKELLDNDTYSSYWQARTFASNMKNIRPAMMTVGGCSMLKTCSAHCACSAPRKAEPRRR